MMKPDGSNLSSQQASQHFQQENLPVVKDLTPHHMATDAPAVGIPLVAQPVVTEHLGVKVVCLERRVVDVHLGPLEEEEAVVVDQVVAAVQPEEDGYVDVVVVVDQLPGSAGAR